MQVLLQLPNKTQVSANSWTATLTVEGKESEISTNLWTTSLIQTFMIGNRNTGCGEFWIYNWSSVNCTDSQDWSRCGAPQPRCRRQRPPFLQITACSCLTGGAAGAPQPRCRRQRPPFLLITACSCLTGGARVGRSLHCIAWPFFISI